MDSFPSTRQVLSTGFAVALLAGCGGWPPIGTPTAIQQNAAIATHAARLLYLSNSMLGYVSIEKYPKGKPVQTLTGFRYPERECVDKAGDVWIADLGNSKILEYARGSTKPITVLHDPGQEPVDCAVDSATGNVAVANYATKHGGTGSVSTYRNAAGKPITYYDPAMAHVKFLSYDPAGNLFVAGDGLTHGFVFAELGRGQDRFRNITLNKTISFASGIQWDGRYIVVGDGMRLYRTSGRKVVGTTRIAALCDNGFFIQGDTVAVLCDGAKLLEIFKYPDGGDAIRSIVLGNLGEYAGVAISR